jgi:hypothetical protein
LRNFSSGNSCPLSRWPGFEIGASVSALLSFYIVIMVFLLISKASKKPLIDGTLNFKTLQLSLKNGANVKRKRIFVRNGIFSLQIWNLR